MRKFECLLSVEGSYIGYYIICMTVPSSSKESHFEVIK